MLKHAINPVEVLTLIMKLAEKYGIEVVGVDLAAKVNPYVDVVLNTESLGIIHNNVPLRRVSICYGKDTKGSNVKVKLQPTGFSKTLKCFPRDPRTGLQTHYKSLRADRALGFIGDILAQIYSMRTEN